MWQPAGSRAYRFSQVDDDIDILQDLLSHCVGAVKLEDDMALEDVLDAEDAVTSVKARDEP